jgi:hypothetical protein
MPAGRNNFIPIFNRIGRPLPLTGRPVAMYYMVSVALLIIVREKKMITHIVLFKLKESTPEGVEQAKEKLLSMQGKVELLRYLEVGVDLIHSERSADIALLTKFASLEDLQAYQVHPYHANEVAAYMRSVCSSVVAADYQSA